MNIQLTDIEVDYGRSEGVRRHIESLERGYKPKYGQNTKARLQNDIDGAIAELAVAKALGVDPGFRSRPHEELKLPDVMEWQVRYTPYATGRLIIQVDDKDHEKFVLVTGTCPNFNIRGWMRGRDAKVSKYKTYPKNGRPYGFWVPQKDLEPFRLGDQSPSRPLSGPRQLTRVR
jgi:hypothetical protein